MKRKIVNIDKEKCNGCGLCSEACHENAIEIVNGKAELVSDEYCDGLGDCLPHCPVDAITIIERESKEYDEEAVQRRIAEKEIKDKMPCGCPGSMAKKIERAPKKVEIKVKEKVKVKVSSELMQWPVQLNLINTQAPYLKNADLLVAADCTAYAYGDFHNEFIKNHITVIGCPKLDDVMYYKDKLKEIIEKNDLKSITVVRMEVPCCGGIVSAVKNAMLEAQVIVPYKEVIIGTNGELK
ncbi:ATP-binding protein [Clostridium felsineum]|uniref:Ion-translocating oxidoreductase complex subunit B n=1 Tax=Clostridium felsineum TaxID=36839 RepID=A0A1S8LPE6_9CLOT|nr:4Fe-4S binding protein [Clostridium felsineum]URZ05686.1 Ion-translocating oxidoreductase complex subunit B [Clostridium felsineum]URZ10725.1 Ion-translocating oxidoreductase complex subunit B [Clostridium felsineum]